MNNPKESDFYVTGRDAWNGNPIPETLTVDEARSQLELIRRERSIKDAIENYDELKCNNGVYIGSTKNVDYYVGRSKVREI